MFRLIFDKNKYFKLNKWCYLYIKQIVLKLSTLVTFVLKTHPNPKLPIWSTSLNFQHQFHLFDYPLK